jgi:hypothetical protein
MICAVASMAGVRLMLAGGHRAFRGKVVLTMSHRT